MGSAKGSLSVVVIPSLKGPGQLTERVQEVDQVAQPMNPREEFKPCRLLTTPIVAAANVVVL